MLTKLNCCFCYGCIAAAVTAETAVSADEHQTLYLQVIYIGPVDVSTPGYGLPLSLEADVGQCTSSAGLSEIATDHELQ